MRGTPTCHPDQPYEAKGLCRRCYHAQWREAKGPPPKRIRAPGLPADGIHNPEFVARVRSRIDASGGPDACHPWTGATSRGKPLITLGKHTLVPRRLVWEYAHGAPPIADRRMFTTCGDVTCVNVHHLRCQTEEERFWTFVDSSGGPDACWPWKGRRHHRGYGHWKRQGGKTAPATRVALEYSGRPVPAGMHACHTCDNPPCTNPAHLWAGTNADNIHDAIAKGRNSRGPKHAEACRRGRELSAGKRLAS